MALASRSTTRSPRSELLLLALVGACAASPSAAQAPQPFSVNDTAAITDVVGKQAAAWNRGDLAGYMEGYAKTDALVFTSGGKIRRGWQQTFDTYRKKYASQPGSMGQLAFDNLEVTPVGEDAAIVLGRWTLDGTEHDGAGVFTLAFERRAEGWRIVHDHTSLDAP